MYKLVKTVLSIFYKIFYKIEVKNGDRLENESGIVISGNHVSNHDALMFPAMFKKNVRFIAKEELFKIVILKQALESTGAISVKRGKFDRACINEAIKGLKNGDIIGIFPEGTRSKSKELEFGKSHNGASFIATRAKAKILTFAIIPEKNFRIFSKVKIVFGDKIDAYELKEQGYSHDEITKVIMDKISEIIKKEK